MALNSIEQTCPAAAGGDAVKCGTLSSGLDAFLLAKCFYWLDHSCMDIY